ncbi:hypothetical protein CBR_g66636 [Chara braunii]|uniref:Coenzyme Q-binding protein COQ10 START domain-containing protein n=1 Tax=Chara braunii TaxID=69332 RepID=A0A388JQ44_CHABU|nr:hypothetical protein CBR_g66636 [Chara braunii]|eukprot:GBG59832.1 hypothetical protein CBR_g66636 [Chara braunii]
MAQHRRLISKPVVRRLLQRWRAVNHVGEEMEMKKTVYRSSLAMATGGQAIPTAELYAGRMTNWMKSRGLPPAGGNTAKRPPFSSCRCRSERSAVVGVGSRAAMVAAGERVERVVGGFDVCSSKFSGRVDRASSVLDPSFLPSALSSQRRSFLSVGDGDEDKDVSRRHKEERLVGYSPEQLFAVVAAVDLYEDFVPWCQSSKVLWRKGEGEFEAELEIGFKLFTERYVSHVTIRRPTLVKTVVSQSNLFVYLDNVWEFRPGPTPSSCLVNFSVDFQFRSPLHRTVANLFFEEVAEKLVSSFEDRCREVYGPSMNPVAASARL